VTFCLAAAATAATSAAAANTGLTFNRWTDCVASTVRPDQPGWFTRSGRKLTGHTQAAKATYRYSLLTSPNAGRPAYIYLHCREWRLSMRPCLRSLIQLPFQTSEQTNTRQENISAFSSAAAVTVPTSKTRYRTLHDRSSLV